MGMLLVMRVGAIWVLPIRFAHADNLVSLFHSFTLISILN